MRQSIATALTLLALTGVACNRPATQQRTQQTQEKSSPSPAANKFSDLEFVGTSARPTLGGHDRRDDEPNAKTIGDRSTDHIKGLKIFSVTAYGNSETGSDVAPFFVLQALFESNEQAATQENFEAVGEVFGAKSFKEVDNVEGREEITYKCGKFANGTDIPFCSYVLGNLLVIVAGEPGIDQAELFQVTGEMAAGHLEEDVKEE
jgi:hypothetical protein